MLTLRLLSVTMVVSLLLLQAQLLSAFPNLRSMHFDRLNTDSHGNAGASDSLLLDLHDNHHGADNLLALDSSSPSVLDTFLPCFVPSTSDFSSLGLGAAASSAPNLAPIFTQFCELAPPPSCFRSVLRQIMPECDTLSDDDRAAFAVRLTLCELALAHIRPPRQCAAATTDVGATLLHNDRVTRSKCLRQLEENPQFWTSFSGNFRSIRTICLSERNNHEKGRHY